MLPQISNQGDTGKTYFSLYDVESPVVVVGSSRASHHYVTKIIEDTLGVPAYNVARDGCFFSYNCCVVNSILDRYSPKMIIWEMALIIYLMASMTLWRIFTHIINVTSG